MPIEFASLKRQYDVYAAEFEGAALRAMRSGWYILGNELKAFEQQFADYTGRRYCVGLNSGLDALSLACRTIGLSKGDEVIIQANAYIASVLCITECGATPVYVEPDAFFGLDADKIEAAITEKTKAILPVHLYGQICDMEKICDIAEKHGIYVIEDCAQCHGSMQRGKMAGTFGVIGCFSFYPTKPVGALGDAGACVTDDPELAEKLRKLRNYGSGVKYYNEMMGVNSRLDEIQAAVLQVGLKHLDEGNEYRRRIAEKYIKGINNSSVELPSERKDCYSVFHIFALLCHERDALQQHLLNCGVKTAIHYPIPPHLQECYKWQGHMAGDFPIAERYAAEELSLPIYVGMPDEEVKAVIAAVNSFKPEA